MKIKDTNIPPRNRVLDQLEQLPDDEVFTTAELTKRFAIKPSSFRRLLGDMPLNAVHLGSVNYYGSIKAIKAFKAHHKIS